MTTHLLPGVPPVEVTLRRSARARRMSLRVSRLDGRVTLTLPPGVPEREALAFARDREGWMREHLSTLPRVVVCGTGAQVPVEGAIYRIVPGSGRAVVRDSEAGTIAVPGAPERVPARLAGWLKALARDRLSAACARYSETLGRDYTRLTLRDTRSRWGSCASSGALSFSWRLILAEPGVLDYVAAHEVAHLAEMNHSRAYWQTLERIHGPYAAPRRWLKTEGHLLHRYRFTAPSD